MNTQQPMREDAGISHERAHGLAELARLDLTSDRIKALAASLANYLAMTEQLHNIDSHGNEPPVLTYDDEVLK